MPYLDIDGDKIHFADQGSGVPVVFVHGGCGGAGQWKNLASRLQDNYRTVCLDLLGSGLSDPWPIEREWSFEIDEKSINAVLDFLNEPVHLIAHSGGCHFSYRSTRSKRDQILSVTYFEPTFFQLLRLDYDPLFAEPEGMATSYRIAMDNHDTDEAMASFVDVWAGAEGAWANLPDPVKNMMLQGSGRLYHEWLGPWADEPSRSDFVELNIPALLIKGSNTIDSMHRVCDITSQSLPNCRYVEIDGAGHMCPFTHAEKTLPTISAHLAAAIN